MAIKVSTTEAIKTDVQAMSARLLNAEHVFYQVKAALQKGDTNKALKLMALNENEIINEQRLTCNRLLRNALKINKGIQGEKK